jgi:hypothetical protein
LSAKRGLKPTRHNQKELAHVEAACIAFIDQSGL